MNWDRRSRACVRNRIVTAGNANPQDNRRQLSRWKTSGQKLSTAQGASYCWALRLFQGNANLFLVANRMLRYLHIKLHQRQPLQHVPEYVPITTSVTTGRLGNWQTSRKLITFAIPEDFFDGHRWNISTEISVAFIASRRSLARPGGLSLSCKEHASMTCSAQIKQLDV